MASDAAAAFEQEMQDVTVAFLRPSFHNPPPALFPPPLLPPVQSDPSFLVKPEQSEGYAAPMQLLTDPTLSYMNVTMDASPMEAVEPSGSLEALAADYAAAAEIAAVNSATAASFALPSQPDATMSLEISPAALSTPSPPLPIMTGAMQPLTSTLQGPSPPFNLLPGSSSLDGALIPTAPLTSPPRASSSVSPVPLTTHASHSPVSIPTPYASSASQSPTATSTSASQPIVLPPAEAENIVIKDEVPIAKQKKEVASLLNALAKDFYQAGQAVQCLDTQEELPDEIKSRIASLSRLAAQLSISSDGSPPPAHPPASTSAPVAPPTPPASVGVGADQHGGYPLPAVLPQFDPLLPDQSRKRGPCELDEHRSVKAMKREPLEELKLPLPAESLPLDASAGFPATSAIPSSHAIPSIAQSRPASPPIPTSFAAAVAQYNMQPPQLYPPGAPIAPPSTVPSNSMPPLNLNLPPLPPTPSAFANGRTAWGDGNVVQSRHHHSLSAGAILNPMQGMQMPPVPVTSSSSLVSGPNTPITTHPPPLVRTGRSGSVSSLTAYESGGFFSNIQEKVPEVPIAGHRSGRSSIAGNWYFAGDTSSSPTNTSEEPSTTRNTPSDDDDEESGSDSDDEVTTSANRSASQTAATDGSSSALSSAPPQTDIPAEYRSEVDRIFFEYLNKICSNLEAKDSKGDHIHQTLMAKKMQRLDESPDFRPFKFRIQAFTTAFLEELARQGYTEDKIPMKKIRNYLWHQPHILRFNEDGKKAKSKGNHIWNVEARKLGDGKWEFRPFHRKLAGTPPGVAYVGLKWTWTPRVWDPQASFNNVPVQYSSPNLPSWLSWKDDQLQGIPPPDAESCHVTVVAQYIHDGVEGVLTRTFPISIAPVGASESSQYPRSRRPSGASDAPRRSASDSALSSAPQRSMAPPRMPVVPVPIPNETSSTRVIRVLQNVAQRVTEEAESHNVPQADSLQDIVKQKHVLDQTVEAMDKELSGQGHMASKRLAIAAQQVVIQAAANVIADRNVSIGRAPVVPNKSTAVQRVSVSELSDATHDAIAAAVKSNGPASTEVDIIVTAASILKAKAPGVEANPPPIAPLRSMPSMNFASNLSTLPELP
ncbi:hypothetical protein NMY22_g2918 [Coprinellus aureogranulatus]|nr:hypothetical protein NMY22_g2918 [Coprinellus aureogranulatus]